MPVAPNGIETGRKLFEEGGWSSGQPYGPDQWFSDDPVMRDIVNDEGALRGKEEIRKFWASRKRGITPRVPVEEGLVPGAHIAGDTADRKRQTGLGPDRRPVVSEPDLQHSTMAPG